MKKKEVIRNYHFPDAELVTISNAKIAFMERDKVQFADYGISPAMVTALKEKVLEFSNFSTDIESLSDQTDATAAKDAKAAELKQELTNFMSRVAAKYTVKSAKYRKFGAGEISQKTDSDLLLTAKRIVRVGTPLLEELATNGVTAAMLTTITTHANSFENLLIDKEIKVGERDIQQEARVEAGNLVYSDLIKYTSIGQAIWAATDVAKYNDFVVYNTANGQAPAEVPPPAV